jgi:hypothetical protein
MWFLLKHEGMLVETPETQAIRQALEVVRRGGGLERSDFRELLG